MTKHASTYDHRLRKMGHPVRSAIPKPEIGKLVVGWVTTSEYLLLYVFEVFSLEVSTSAVEMLDLLVPSPIVDSKTVRRICYFVVIMGRHYFSYTLLFSFVTFYTDFVFISVHLA
jgi:hypothetical protein